MGVGSVLKDIREKNKRLQEENIKRVYEKIPEVKKIDDEIKDLSLDFFKGNNVSDKIENLNRKKEELLKKYKVPKGYLDLKYNCDKCKDQGFITYELDGRVYQKECSCRKRIAQSLAYDNSSIRSLLERQNFKNFDISIFSTSRNKNTEDISQRNNMAEIKKEMEDFSKKFPRQRKGKKGLFFYGPTGTGKTYMCSCIAKAIIDRGYAVYYQTSSELLDFLASYSFMFYEEKMKYKDKYDFIYDSDLLIIDDLGSEYINDKTRVELFNLINSRLNRNKPIVISSNIDVEEISEIYGERIYSRIVAEYDIFNFFGRDVRLSFLD